MIRTFSVGLGCVTSKIKELILGRQKMGDKIEWHDDINFRLLLLLHFIYAYFIYVYSNSSAHRFKN